MKKGGSLIRLFFTEIAEIAMENWFAKLLKRRKSTAGLTAEGSLSDLLPFNMEDENDLISADRLHVVRQFRDNVEGQLKIIQLALQASSVILYWSALSADQLVPYSSFSTSSTLNLKPIPAATGILGALKRQSEISLFPCHAESPAIPYYRKNPDSGSFFAKVVACSAAGQHAQGDFGVLCVDRHSDEDWTQNEKLLIETAAERIISYLLLSRDLLFTDVERRTLQLVFNGLQGLNSALDLDSVYSAAEKALEQIVEADYFAVSLLDGDSHKLCYVTGDFSEGYINKTFSLDDSLVGQVVKYRRVLPENSTRSLLAPVVNGLKLFDTCQSVLVVPLLQEDGSVTGVLIIASRKQKKISRSCREMMIVIASQVAIKIELARSHHQIQQMTITDPLTGIANRRAFQRGFSAMSDRARRRDGSFCLIICDIDLFKLVNDTHGHSFGDVVIQRVSSLLNEIVRTGDLAARIGGEEFAVLLEDTGLEGAFDVAERLRKKVESLGLFFEGKAVPITISLGVAAFPHDSDNQEILFSYADQALYRAKETGRNCSVCWSRIA